MNAYDYLALHRNVNRIVGNEFIDNTVEINSSINLKKSIENLIDNGYLYISEEPNITLQKLKVPELKEILRNNNLKVGGNKPQLIERILENYSSIKIDNELPKVYKATEKGMDLIQNTNYIDHFANNYAISLIRATAIAQNDINSDDKIEFIYLHEVKRLLNDNDISELNLVLHSLVIYYQKNSNDKDKIRQFTNISHYTSVLRNIDDESRYYGIPVSEYVLSASQNEKFYESLLLVDKIPPNVFVELFMKDVENFYNKTMPYTKEVAQYLVADVLKDNNTKSSILNLLNKNTHDIHEHKTYEVKAQSTNNTVKQSTPKQKINSNIKKHEKHSNDEQQNALYGCGCLIAIIIFVTGCTALAF
ncbi:SAP domain-containing protein [Staphylococcus felis]|uniref:SAP domain-containing protein n=1 Tax=Staphylococcus felis TaxID=46127 RepID=UPI003967115A